jgi:transposase
VTGLTSLAIIDAICKGEKSPENLPALRHGNCKRSEEEIAKAPQNNGRKDYLFGLKQEYQLYVNFQKKMKKYDVEIEKLLKEQINNDDEKKQHFINKRVTKR